MGREPWSNRVMVEECESISIYEGRVKELLRKYQPALDFKLVVTVLRDGVKAFEQNIFIGRTTTRYGGYRLWFSCGGCHRKTARLFLTPRGNRFKCRKCHNLTYRSQKKHKSPEEKFFRQFTRSTRQAWQLRDSLHEPISPRNHKKGGHKHIEAYYKYTIYSDFAFAVIPYFI